MQNSRSKWSKWIAALITASMLTACTESNGAPGRGVENGGALSNTDVGTAVGAIGGGIIGYQFGAGAGQALGTVGGALLGGILGNQIGHSMDNAAMASYDQASQSAMETGQVRTWKNGDNHGRIVPHKRYTNEEGQYCREYSQTIYIGSEKHTGYGTACRESDGTWRIVE